MGFGLGSLGNIGKVVAGGLLGGPSGALEVYGQQEANSANRAAANAAYERSTEGFKHRYQLQMQDMERAGLNPILSYRQAPPGGPVGLPWSEGNVFSGIAQTVTNRANTAVAARRQAVDQRIAEEQIQQIQAAVQNVRADTTVKGATARQIDADTRLKIAQTNASIANAAQSTASTKQITQQEVLTKLQQEIARERAKIERAAATGAAAEQELLETAFGKVLKWIDLVGRSINPFASTAARVKGLSE